MNQYCDTLPSRRIRYRAYDFSVFTRLSFITIATLRERTFRRTDKSERKREGERILDHAGSRFLDSSYCRESRSQAAIVLGRGDITSS